MKKILLSAFVIAGLIACGDSGGKKEDTPASAEPATENTSTAGSVSENPDYKAGLKLVAASDCLTCHKVDEKLIGPSYKEVAGKYSDANADTITALANTIIKGSQGKWGEVPMTPHPDLSQADAEAMVKYVLLLK